MLLSCPTWKPDWQYDPCSSYDKTFFTMSNKKPDKPLVIEEQYATPTEECVGCDSVAGINTNTIVLIIAGLIVGFIVFKFIKKRKK